MMVRISIQHQKLNLIASENEIVSIDKVKKYFRKAEMIMKQQNIQQVIVECNSKKMSATTSKFISSAIKRYHLSESMLNIDFV